MARGGLLGSDSTNEEEVDSSLDESEVPELCEEATSVESRGGVTTGNIKDTRQLPDNIGNMDINDKR